MKRHILILILALFTFTRVFSQTVGITYQAVILNPNEQQIPGYNITNGILADTYIAIKFTIVNEMGNIEYGEYHNTRTDKYGMVNVLIGTGIPLSPKKFLDIIWDGKVKKLKVAIDFGASGNNYQEFSEQLLSYMPQPANSQVYDMINKNLASINDERKRAIAAEESNAAEIDALKKDQIIQNETIAATAQRVGVTDVQAAIIAATSGTNTGDQDISGIAINAKDIVDLKAEQIVQNNTIALNTAKKGVTTEQSAIIAATSGTNTGDQDLSGLATKAALSDSVTKIRSEIPKLSDYPTANYVTTALADKVDKISGKGLSTEDYSSAEKSKLAAIIGTNTGDQDLSGLATKVALGDSTSQIRSEIPDVSGFATTSNVTTALADKVDKVSGKGLSTEDYSSAEKTKLAAIIGTNTGDQDLSGLATKVALGDSTSQIRSEIPDVSGFATTSNVTTALADKVDKVSGKGLS
uniref:hypothetical protein n=1 Tax=Fulvivirga sp. TaxID=1931237 RepID=UPI00404B74E3